MNHLHLKSNDVGISGSMILRTGSKLLGYNLQSRITWNKMTLTSSLIGQMGVCAKRLGIIHRALREVQVVGSGSIIKGPEISLYSTSVLSYGQYSLRLWRLSSGPVSNLNHDPLSKAALYNCLPVAKEVKSMA
jgi:hypothetical protein